MLNQALVFFTLANPQPVLFTSYARVFAATDIVFSPYCSSCFMVVFTTAIAIDIGCRNLDGFGVAFAYGNFCVCTTIIVFTRVDIHRDTFFGRPIGCFGAVLVKNSQAARLCRQRRCCRDHYRQRQHQAEGGYFVCLLTFQLSFQSCYQLMCSYTHQKTWTQMLQFEV